MTPFSGTKRNDNNKDTTNFYLSQLRIKINQDVGYITNKWKILKRPFQIKVSTSCKLFLFITRLHNYCINEGDIVHENNCESLDLTGLFPQ